VGSTQFGHLTRSGRRCGHDVLVRGLGEVGADFPQSRELEPFAQFAERDGKKRNPVLVRLDPVAVLEEKHDVGDVLLIQAIRAAGDLRKVAVAPGGGSTGAVQVTPSAEVTVYRLWGPPGGRAAVGAWRNVCAAGRPPEIIASFALDRFAAGVLVGEKGAAAVGH
jgi:hypothetical protein